MLALLTRGDKGGHEGFYHEKADTHVFASETLAREWVKRLGEEGEEELDSGGLIGGREGGQIDPGAPQLEPPYIDSHWMLASP